MKPLYLIEIRLQASHLFRFAGHQGLRVGADEDLGYTVHAWMRAAFQEVAPRPWRLLYPRNRPPRILGYGAAQAEELRSRLREFADPTVIQAVAEDGTAIASKPMPEWKEGRRLGFEVSCCPVGRQSDPAREKDIFLVRADHEKPGSLERGRVYRSWLKEQMEREGAVDVEEVRMDGFRLVRQVRKRHTENGGRRQTGLIRPQVLLSGILVVREPSRFQKLLRAGIGRHRAFGYGMVLIRPPS